MKKSSWKIYLAFFVGALFVFILLSFYPEFANLGKSKQEKNKRLVLEAFDAAFTKKKQGPSSATGLLTISNTARKYLRGETD